MEPPERFAVDGNHIESIASEIQAGDALKSKMSYGAFEWKLESPQVLAPKLFFLCFLVWRTTVMRVRQSQGT